MQYKWEVDADNRVEAKVAGFRKKRVFHNGTEIQSWRGGKGPPFALTDGSRAQVHVTSGIASVDVELRVNGQPVRPTPKGGSSSCPSCGARVGGIARFCDSCGAPLPSAEDLRLSKRVKDASKTLMWLAVLFVVSGGLLFLAARSGMNDALADLASYADADVLEIDGEPVTVADLRSQVTWEARSVLIVNLVLAAIMLALYQWSKSSPFPAFVVAIATYSVVIVGNAIVEPTTLMQGILIKVIVYALLFRGLKSALALRTARA